MTDSITTATTSDKPAFLQTLKTSTAGLHQLLESNVLLSAIVSSTVTINQYGCYLSLMQKVLEVYEQNVLPFLAGVVNIAAQTKASALIEQDLRHIGFQLPAGSLPADYVTPKKMTLPFALGIMYVMEGSKLGGKVIFKHIQNTLGFSADCGARFVSDYGSNTGNSWREFLASFSMYISESGGEEEAIRGANHAFKSIHEFFESNSLVYDN